MSTAVIRLSSLIVKVQYQAKEENMSYNGLVHALFGFLRHLFVFQQSVYNPTLWLYLVIWLLISPSTVPCSVILLSRYLKDKICFS